MPAGAGSGFIAEVYSLQRAFHKLAHLTAEAVGSPWAFLMALVVTLAWAATGPFFHYSDTWQLIINTGTTIATFLIVFLIQHTQNRDAKVLHLKLDELIRAIGPARTELVNMESLTDEELKRLQNEFKQLQEHAATGLKRIEESRKTKERPARV
jgi:low affinity Fe/Cu permease